MPPAYQKCPCCRFVVYRLNWDRTCGVCHACRDQLIGATVTARGATYRVDALACYHGPGLGRPGGPPQFAHVTRSDGVREVLALPFPALPEED